MASATRDPAGSRTRPGRTTRPATATTMTVDASEAGGPVGRVTAGTASMRGRDHQASVAATVTTTTATTASARIPRRRGASADDSARPGGAGVRPSEARPSTGDRPGEVGPRPGEAGDRPGEAGPRPGEAGPSTCGSPTTRMNRLRTSASGDARQPVPVAAPPNFAPVDSEGRCRPAQQSTERWDCAAWWLRDGPESAGWVEHVDGAGDEPPSGRDDRAGLDAQDGPLRRPRYVPGDLFGAVEADAHDRPSWTLGSQPSAERAPVMGRSRRPGQLGDGRQPGKRQVVQVRAGTDGLRP